MVLSCWLHVETELALAPRGLTCETETMSSETDTKAMKDMTEAPVGSEGGIRRVAPDVPFKDVMNGDSRWEIPVHDHGFVALVDSMPRLVPEGQTADSAIVQAARVSYGAGTKKVNEDRGLIRYLLRHRHTTPLEMVEFKFHIAMPIFVARQWIRHRTANVNEYSARYSIMPDRFYRPSLENVRKQSTSNRQGGDEPIEAGTAEEFLKLLEDSEALYTRYIDLTEKGVDYANAMYELIKGIVPITCEAFEDYRLNAMHLTSLEIEAIRKGQPLDSTNKREIAEWEAKRADLGLA
jgi:thymidylate synthase (FAD)